MYILCKLFRATNQGCASDEECTVRYQFGGTGSVEKRQYKGNR